MNNRELALNLAVRLEESYIYPEGGLYPNVERVVRNADRFLKFLGQGEK